MILFNIIILALQYTYLETHLIEFFNIGIV